MEILVPLDFQERMGSRVVSKAIEDFLQFIDNHSLVDLLLNGALYTWSSLEDSFSRSRLYIFLMSTF